MNIILLTTFKIALPHLNRWEVIYRGIPHFLPTPFSIPKKYVSFHIQEVNLTYYRIHVFSIFDSKGDINVCLISAAKTAKCEV